MLSHRIKMWWTVKLKAVLFQRERDPLQISSVFCHPHPGIPMTVFIYSYYLLCFFTLHGMFYFCCIHALSSFLLCSKTDSTYSQDCTLSVTIWVTIMSLMALVSSWASVPQTSAICVHRLHSWGLLLHWSCKHLWTYLAFPTAANIICSCQLNHDLKKHNSGHFVAY